MLPHALLVLLLWNSAAFAQASDSAAQALQGHAAEARQWAGEKDALRRPLFLDPVEIESERVGVDCSHRPQGSAGYGHVVLIETLENPPRRIRHFSPPGAVDSLAAARVVAMTFARTRVPGVELHQMAARTFPWCR